MKHFIYTCLFICFILNCNSGFGQSTTPPTLERSISSTEYLSLIGNWSGTLTYIDYSSNKPYTMPVEYKISQGKNELILLIDVNYPNETSANKKAKLNRSADGTHIDKHPIVSKEKLDNDALKFITEYTGKDNNQKSTIRLIYTLGDNVLTIQKKVQYPGNVEWKTRNTFSFKRVKN